MKLHFILKKPYVKSIICFLSIIGFIAIVISCSQDSQQRLARKGVEYLDGNYNVTYTDQGVIKVWNIKNGKVTSDSGKGYYFFWAENSNGKKIYVQVPINRTFIEEVVN